MELLPIMNNFADNINKLIENIKTACHGKEAEHIPVLPETVDLNSISEFNPSEDSIINQRE